MTRLILLFLFMFSSTVLAQDETVPADNDQEEIENPDSGSQLAPEGLDTASSDSSEPSTEQALVERTQPNPSARRVSEVVRHLGLFNRSQEVIKFSDDEASISGLYLPENTGKPQGGILILHDIDQHAHWPSTIGPLREYLPDYGWNTLSLFFDGYIQPPLPTIPAEAVASNTPPDTSNETDDLTKEEPALADIAPTPEESTNDPFDENVTNESQDENFDADGSTGGDELDSIAEDFQPFPVPSEEQEEIVEDNVDVAEQFVQSMTERVEGGLRQLNTLGQFNLVVVAHGLSANWAANTLKNRFEQNPEAVGYALVLVNAKQSVYPNFELNTTLAQFNIPILDIYTQGDEHQKRIAVTRRNTIVREQKAKYMQVRLPSIRSSNTEKQNMITRRVRGWLKTHAAGEEVNVAEKRY